MSKPILSAESKAILAQAQGYADAVSRGLACLDSGESYGCASEGRFADAAYAAIAAALAARDAREAALRALANPTEDEVTALTMRQAQEWAHARSERLVKLREDLEAAQRDLAAGPFPKQKVGKP